MGARELSVAGSADAIESIGFEWTRSGACCEALETDDGDREEHTATPAEVRPLGNAAEDAFGRRDIAPPTGAALDREAPRGSRSGKGPGRAIDRRNAEEGAAR